MATRFDRDRFIADCQTAVADGQAAIREHVQAAVADPAGVMAALGEPEQPGVFPLYQAPDLTIINFVWAPYMSLLPHNHRMFAVIGIYAGREDNMFWRQLDEAAPDRPQVEAAGAKSMGAGEVATMGRDIIHSVANPIGKLTSAIHVYGGDFFEPPAPRSQWNYETLREEPWDMDNTRDVFRRAGVRYNAGLAAGVD